MVLLSSLTKSSAIMPLSAPSVMCDGLSARGPTWRARHAARMAVGFGKAGFDHKAIAVFDQGMSHVAELCFLAYVPGSVTEARFVRTLLLMEIHPGIAAFVAVTAVSQPEHRPASLARTN